MNMTQTAIKSLSPEGRLEVHQTVVPPNQVHPFLNKTKLRAIDLLAESDAAASAVQEIKNAPTIIWGGNRVKGFMHEIAQAGYRRQRHQLSDWMERYHKGGACAHNGAK